MKVELGADALAPLWSVAEGDPEPTVRIAALDAASKFSLSVDSWRQCERLTRRIVQSEPAGSPARRAALDLAARIPLLSVRRQLRKLAVNDDDPDSDAVAAALDRIADPSRIRPLLERAKIDRGTSFQELAAMPVEDEGLTPGDIPPLPENSAVDAPLWRALVLARLGDFASLQAILEGPGPEPEMFWGNPWTAYNALASMRPVPPPMHEYLLDAMERLEDTERYRMVRLIAGAATGLYDAEGSPIPPADVTNGETIIDTPPPSRERENHAVAAAKRLPQRLFTGAVSPDEIEALADLPPKRFATLVTRTFIEANKQARALPSDAPANMLLGNKVISIVQGCAPGADWPVARLAVEHLNAERPALDEEQMAWVLARDRPNHLISEMTDVLKPVRPVNERLRILNLLGKAANQQAGRGGSPFRGSGSGGAAEFVGRGALIDDRQTASAKPPPREEAEAPQAEMAEARSTGDAEERRVHALIRHEGKRRHTFVTGADNVIRCWIGLPRPEEAAVAASAVPRVEIPREGLELTAVLCWGDQSDSNKLLLPAERSADSNECDLRIRVPDGETYVSAEIVFQYRGRAFEVVQVEAQALAPVEQEQPHHQVKVRVQVSRREVIKLTDGSEYNATMVWGVDSARPGQAAAPASLRVFGGQGGKRYNLKDSGAAVKWLNDELFATEKSLVRQRAGHAGAEEVLDGGDPGVLALLRSLARHGANLYNQLREQGFNDPGERIQLLNLEPDTHVPLEFVYDRGYPADDARLCDGWFEALTADGRHCPACGDVQITPGQRQWMPVICPRGFWSLQKIIERLDVDDSQDGSGAVAFSAPGPERRSLPVIDSMVFASSHKVPPEERESTWQALQQNFKAPVQANNWEEWREAVKGGPPLLLVLPHHDVEAALDYLEIGDEQLPAQLGHLSRGQLTEIYVNPEARQPGPIVLLLGCRTAAKVEDGYVQLARRFQRLHTSIVLGTLAQILGRHAAPVARELVGQLVAVTDAQADFGTIMRRVRRRMLARGYLMALCLVTLGDAEWRFTPRPSANLT